MNISESIADMLRERETIMAREYSEALAFAGFGAGDRVLDVATGSGRMLQQLVAVGCSVVSGDISQSALDAARERLGEQAASAELLLLDARNLPFEAASFSAITMANAVHEMRDAAAVFGELARVIDRPGKLLVVEFNDRGFELMEAHHKASEKGPHSRGEMSTEQIDEKLAHLFPEVTRRDYRINHVWLAERK